MSHTPGPWAADDGEIVAEDGTHVVCIGHDYDDYGGIRGRWPKAADGQTPHDIEAQYDREIEANARLIAAAPDLLEALEGVMPGLHGEWCGCHEGFDDWRHCSSPSHWSIGEDARAAITKARPLSDLPE